MTVQLAVACPSIALYLSRMQPILSLHCYILDRGRLSLICAQNTTFMRLR